MKHLRLLALCVLTAGLLYHCAPSKPLIYDTTYDFDIRADFKTMRHYAWLPFPVTATITPLNVDRVKYFVDITLSSRGITESKSMPDFLIEPNGRLHEPNRLHRRTRRIWALPRGHIEFELSSPGIPAARLVGRNTCACQSGPEPARKRPTDQGSGGRYSQQFSTAAEVAGEDAAAHHQA